MVRKTMLVVAVATLGSVGSAFAANPLSVDPRGTITATMDAGTAKTANTWYEVGVNTAAPTTGLKTGTVSSAADSLSSYLFAPATGNNVLLLDLANKTGTLTLVTPVAAAAISFATSSGNGTGNLTGLVHFTDGTSDALPLVTGQTYAFQSPDWFNSGSKVQTSHGRIDVGNPGATPPSTASFQNVASATDPSVNAVNITLPAADAAKLIQSIDLTTLTGGGTHTALFALSTDKNGSGHFSPAALTAGSLNQDVIVGAKEVPEPASLGLLALGALGLLARRRIA